MFVTTERVLLCAALFSSAPAYAGEPARPPSPQTVYQYDRADCMSGRAGPDKTACLREAGAALQEAKTGKLVDANADFSNNRVARCDYLKDPDRGYCLRRMNGEGTVKGSVEEGAILRELVVTVPE